MSRMTTHACECGRRISAVELVFDDQDRPMHRRCWRDKKHAAERLPKMPPPPPVPTAAATGSLEKPREDRVKSQDARGAKTLQPPPPLPEEAEQSLRIVKRGNGWCDVYDPQGNKVNPTPVRKKAAEAFVEEANQGEVTE